MMKRRWQDRITWYVILYNGTKLTKDYCKDVKKLECLNIKKFVLELDNKIIKEIDVTGNLIYFHRVFGSLFPFKEERRIIYFGTETNLWKIEPISGTEGTGCNLAFHIIQVQ